MTVVTSRVRNSDPPSASTSDENDGSDEEGTGTDEESPGASEDADETLEEVGACEEANYDDDGDDEDYDDDDVESDSHGGAKAIAAPAPAVLHPLASALLAVDPFATVEGAASTVGGTTDIVRPVSASAAAVPRTVVDQHATDTADSHITADVLTPAAIVVPANPAAVVGTVGVTVAGAIVHDDAVHGDDIMPEAKENVVDGEYTYFLLLVVNINLINKLICL